MKPIAFFKLSLISMVLLLIWGCGDDPAVPGTGSLQVAVYDQGNPSLPVAGVAIRIMPVDLVSNTNEIGIVVFELPAGEYFVDAAVCCVGPGFIEYHEAASVVREQTTEIVLPACMACVYLSQ